MEAQRKSVALVTGGSSGIGLELAKLFVADGHDVVIAADDKSKLEEAVQTLLRLGRVLERPGELQQHGAEPAGLGERIEVMAKGVDVVRGELRRIMRKTAIDFRSEFK